MLINGKTYSMPNWNWNFNSKIKKPINDISVLIIIIQNQWNNENKIKIEFGGWLPNIAGME